ncbi:MAG: glutamate-5-semialdehyde dehydrogenase [Chloroflexi bacterium]|nr:glutamate-5-semialdehyde dehydrogenase [Chloroflexota bacterium]
MDTTQFPELDLVGRQARQAARTLRTSDTPTKNTALEAIAETVLDQQNDILEANARDLDEGQAAGLSAALLERLMLNEGRLADIADGVRSVVALRDPVGESFDGQTLPNGLRVVKRRVPIGVIGAIYESRPNVTVDIAALCLKSGNAAILRGGKEAAHSNRALANAVCLGCEEAGLPATAVQLIQTQDRELVRGMLRANQYIDMIIPRGGAGLHRFALENATIPVITGGIGICHVYVDQSADADKVLPIVYNAKVQRPTVCNALDVLLVHSSRAEELLPGVAAGLARASVELRCDPRSYEILKDHALAKEAGPDDFDTEFLSLVLAIKVVDSLDDALEHVHQHSTQHSDAIITENYSHAMRFVDEVDSAAVYVNASTRFTDGGQFGLGAEVAISTQRLHARGPMALQELTTYKWVILGNGQVRP